MNVIVLRAKYKVGLLLLTALIGVLLVACNGANGGGETLPPVPTQANVEAVQSEQAAEIEPIVVQSSGDTQAESAVAASAEPTPIPPTPVPTAIPTATPRPIAASVNGAIIYQDEYDARFAQFQNWYPNGTPDGTELAQFTLDNMITQRLLAQTAEANGIVVSAETVQNAIDQAISDSGGQEAYQVWLSQSGHDEASFRAQVSDEIMAQAVVGWVTRDVPLSADYVRARYIQVDDFDTAQAVLTDLRAGGDFATLVDIYSVEPSKQTTRGDLGFFRRGTLLVPIVEDTAFGLQPEEVSEVVTHTRDDGSPTYFIVQTVEVQLGRKLSQEEYATSLRDVFETWLADTRNAAAVETFVDN